MPYIWSNELAVYLTLKPVIMTLWPVSDKPPVTIIRRRQHHTHDDVDDWLATRPTFGFKRPLTLGQLMRREIVLIRREDAGKLIAAGRNISDITNYVHRRIVKGELPAIQLRGQTWALCLNGVKDFIARLNAEQEDFTLKDMRHILGTPLTTLHRVIKSGELEVSVSKEHKRHVRITRPNLLAAIAKLLPKSTKISAEEWLAARLGSTQRFMSVKTARLLLGLSDREFRILLDTGDLPYIRSLEGGVFFILPEPVAAHVHNSRELTPGEIVHILGATTEDVAWWFANGYLACPVSGHEDPATLRIGCLTAILQPLCGPKVLASHWIPLRLNNPDSEMWGEGQAAKYVNEPVATFARRFNYIRIPATRQRKFIGADIVAGRSKRL